MGNFSSTQKIQGQRFGGFSKEEVKCITTIFQEVQGNDEKMDKLLFGQKLYLVVDPEEEEGEKELQSVFEFFDVDKSGQIDIYKFICQLALLRQQTPQNKALVLFNIYAGKNRVLSKEELKSMLMSMQNTILKRDMTVKIDQKGGQQSQEERELQIIKLVNNYFAQHDQNKDGVLGFDEFRNVFLSESNIIHKFLRNCNLLTDDDQKILDGIQQEDFDEDLQSEMNLINQTTNQEQNDRKNGIDHNVDPDEQFQQEDIEKGDQMMAHLANVRYSAPDDIEKITKIPIKQLSNQPQQQLELDYVYGFKSDNVRNTVKYNSENQLVYPQAAVIVKLDQNKNTQKFNLDHNDDIISIDCHGDLVVTGQIGHKPLLCVWDSVKDQSFVQIRGDLQKGINHVAFNEDGTKIVATAMDEDHFIYAYDIYECSSNQKKGKPVKCLASGKGPKATILNLIYDRNQVITCCEKAVYFCEVNTKISKIVSKKGIFGNAPMCAIIAGQMFNGNLVTGNVKGQLYIWNGTSVSQVKQSHKGAILTMFNNKNSNELLTAGNDGKINIFDKTLQTPKTIDLNNIGFDIMKSDRLNTVVIRSICSNPKNDIVVGTRQGEIIEIKDYIKCNIVMKGHYDQELWGMACFTQQEWIVTVGEDGLLALWDLHTRKQIKSTQIGFQAKTVDVNHDKTQIAVGCKNGQVLFYDISLKRLQFKENLKKEISIVKYSPKNNILAVGVAPPISKGQQVQQIGSLVGSPSRIIHLDYSEDGKTIQLNNTSYELLYYDSTSCTQLTSGESQFKNERWNTYSIIKGWGVQGIWPPASDGSDINSVARNNQRDVVITGDDWGFVKMFNYPCHNKKSQFNSYKGHSAHVTNVQFSFNDKYAISIGGADKAIFQWKYTVGEQTDNNYQDNMKQNTDDDDDDDGNKSGDDHEQEDELDMFKQDKVEVGDQRLAVDPAFGQIKGSTPVGFKVNHKVHNVVPNGNLKLNHVIGHCCYDGYKNNIQLYSQNNVVMASAGLGVTMNIVTKEQDFFRNHDEDVISMAIHPNNSIVATGQKAAKSKAKCINLFLWNMEDKQVIANFNQFHLREIQLLQFNKSGDRLLSIGRDDDNSVAIWNWSIQNLQCTSPVDKQGVRTVVWSNDTEFITSGPKHIKFWQINGKNIKAKLGQFCREVSTCAVYFQDKAVLGTVKGQLILYQGTQISSKTSANCKGSVSQLLTVNDQLLVGCQDGKINIFNLVKGKLESSNSLDITQFSKSTNYMVTSLDYKFSQLLIATAGGDILISNESSEQNSGNEVKFANDYKLVQQGHFKQELWGLAISPNNNRFVTCGDDMTVRLWDVSRKFEQIAIQTEFTSILRAIDWAPSNEFIIAADSKGKIYLLDNNKLNIIKSVQSNFKVNPKKRGDPWIEDLKISPDSQLCAFGAHGGNFHMQVMNCGKNKLETKCMINTTISSALIHLDWCNDNSTIVINSQAYELMWFDIHSKKMSSPVKDYEQYYSWTCKVGFQSQGISQKGMDGSDINSVCRNTMGTCIASGDDNSKVCLYSYPSVVKNSVFKSYSGHSSHVTTVRFSRDDCWLISTGGYDKCILVWKTDFGKNIQSIKSGDQNMIEQDHNDSDDDDDNSTDYSTDVVQKKIKSNKHKSKSSQNVINGDINDEFEVEIDAGDEFMAVKPWLGAIKQPSNFVQFKNAANKPSCTIELDYVFGYRTKDMRNNIKQLKDGRVVFNAAALGIVLDTTNNTQTFFNKHIDDITGLDVNCDMKTVATGEIGPKPSIYLWDSDTKEELCVFKGNLQKGINNLSFSPDGLNLVASAIDTDNHIGVFRTDIANRHFSYVNSFKSGGSYIVDLKMLNERQFVSVGKRFYKFWEQKSAGNYTGSLVQGIKDQKGTVVYMCAIQNQDNKILVGSTKGTLVVFQGKVFSQELDAHSRSIDCLSQNNDKTYFYSGSKDGTLIVWTSELKQYHILDLNSLDKSLNLFDSGIRSIWNTNDNDSWIIGTYGGDILEVKHKNQEKGSYGSTLMNSHYTPNRQWTNEVWGLAPMNDTQYVSASDDGTLRIWDRETRKQIKSNHTQLDTNMKQISRDPKTKDLRDVVKGRCVDVNQDQKTIAVGFKDGTVRIYNHDLEQKTLVKHAKEWISDVKFSPDGTKLAVGSHDNAIYVYDVEEYQLKRKKYKMNKHSSYITHLDWSEDSCYLHSTCGAYELLFWDVIGGKQMPGGASALKDENWYTWTTTLGFPVQGIWPKYADGTDINYVDRSTIKHPDGYHLVATGDDFGTVKMLRYPSIVKNSDSVVGRGHSSHVTTIKFSYDDKFLYSAGGEDNCIFQWKVEMQ